MGVNSNQYLQGINVTTGTGAPTHSAVSGDRYTDTATGNTYQYTTSWQTVSYSAGGLTYFTEAQSTASPNATVNVDSLTAVASTTDADFAIRPKGTGAILGNIPDNLSSGGNKRGQNSVDLQTIRSSNTEVASGNYSVISGGRRNLASGLYSAVMGGYVSYATGESSMNIGGYASSASAYCSITGGYQNSASSNSSIALGSSCTASNSYSVSIGYQNNVSGIASSAFGQLNTVNEHWSFTSGYYNSLTGRFSNINGTGGADFGVWSRQVFSSYNSVVGDSQKSTLILNKRTTDATPTVLTVQGGSVGTTTQLTLQNNNSIRFKGSIIARQSGSTNTSAWDIDGIIQRATSAATTTLLISNVNVVQNTPSWGTPTLTANTTLGCLTVTVTGASTTNIQWTCAIDTTEVIYA